VLCARIYVLFCSRPFFFSVISVRWATQPASVSPARARPRSASPGSPAGSSLGAVNHGGLPDPGGLPASPLAHAHAHVAACSLARADASASADASPVGSPASPSPQRAGRAKEYPALPPTHPSWLLGVLAQPAGAARWADEGGSEADTPRLVTHSEADAATAAPDAGQFVCFAEEAGADRRPDHDPFISPIPPRRHASRAVASLASSASAPQLISPPPASAGSGSPPSHPAGFVVRGAEPPARPPSQPPSSLALSPLKRPQSAVRAAANASARALSDENIQEPFPGSSSRGLEPLARGRGRFRSDALQLEVCV
jgi:hypothetical protein